MKGARSKNCNFHIYTPMLRRNLPLPYNLIQYLEVQTQVKQRLWSPQLCRSPSRKRSSELRQKGCWRNKWVQGGAWVQGGRDRRHVFSSSEFSLCQESHWIQWGNLSWNARKVAGLVSIVWSLSVSQLCWPQVHLVSTHLPGLEAGSEGWERSSRGGSAHIPSAAVHRRKCCCNQNLNCQWRNQIPPHQPFLHKVSSAEKSSTATRRQETPPSKKTLKIHGIQCTLSGLDCLHLYPFPWLYVLSLTGWLHSADTLQHCSGLPHPDFTQKGLLSFHWLLAQLGN